ncbi:transcriptional repressor [Oceanidesulfovibrio marinus]|uniref:Transcriptional repressor n=2 Tax=Oceanidesulfovibrio marinus TaxID=370038 RepID=A0ABX6NJL5_9BACT|nr:transcriptional repressor [Oceanidesulfovibrio marinus]
MIMNNNTHTHPTEKDSASASLAFRTACRRAGLKVTHQREVIFEEISRARDHPSAEKLFQRVRGRIPSVSIDTVYRTLDMLEDAGFVVKIRVRGATRFDGDVSDHHHFCCSVCGRVYDFAWREFDALEPPEAARECGEIRSSRVVLEGVCSRCAATREDETAAAHGCGDKTTTRQQNQ